MSAEMFESLRLIFVIAAVLLRMVLMPIYLQAYLNLAYDRIEDQKKEAGRITNTEYKQVGINNFHFHQISFLTFFFSENHFNFLLSVRRDIAIYSTNFNVLIFIVHV
jgi:hypothetical protein